MNHFVSVSSIEKRYLQSKSPDGRKIWMVYPSCSTLLATTFWVLALFASVFTPLPSAHHSEFCVLTPNIFSTIIPSSFSSYTNMYRSTCTELKTPEKAKFTGHYINVCSQCGNCCMSPFWRPEFIMVAPRLICGPVAHGPVLTYILDLLLKYPH